MTTTAEELKTPRIRDIIKKPSQAIRAMIRGLQRQGRRKQFRIKMSSWGHTEKEMCYGCAATCTVQEIAHRNLVPGKELINDTYDRARFFGFDRDDLDNFEQAMNQVRLGSFISLYWFLGIQCRSYPVEVVVDKWHEWCADRGSYDVKLTDNTWHKRLPLYTKLAQMLEKAGY